jgi:hypothetical protein
VIDGYVVGATVCDADGHCAVSGANGEVSADFDGTALTSTGGKVDINQNGIADSFEPDAVTMKAPAGYTLITPITTLVAEGADPQKLAEVTGMDVDTLLNTDPIAANNPDLIKLYQTTAVVIQNNAEKNLITQINTYTPTQTSTTVLPDVNNDVTATMSPGVTLYATLAKNSVTDYTTKNFIDYIVSSSAASAADLDVVLETNRMTMTTPSTTTTGNLATTYTTTTVTGDMNTTTTVTTTTPTTTTTTSTSGNILPDIDGTSTSSTSTSATSLELEPNSGTSTASTDTLPKFSSEPVYTLPQYVVKIAGSEIEVNKIDDHNFEFKSPVYFNINDGEEFNLTVESDFNFSSVFDDTVATDGNYYGTIFLHYYDEDNSSVEMNLTIKNVKFKIYGSKLTNIYFVADETEFNLTSPEANDTATVADDYTFNAYEANLTDVILNDGNLGTIKDDIVSINNNDFNTTNHDYVINYQLSFAGITDNVKGKYKIIDSVAPTLDINNGEPWILPRNTDVNITVGTTNKDADTATCTVDPSGGLSCKIDSTGNVYLEGKTDDALEKLDSTITLTDSDGNEVSKSIVIEILDPADTALVQNWDLDSDADGNYSDKKIFMEINGTVSTDDIVDVNTTATDVPNGSPENNVTVYLYKDQDALNGNGGDYIKFIFDADVYGDNDVFVLKNDDGKVVKFRVGDVTSSNNSFYFTDNY